MGFGRCIAVALLLAAPTAACATPAPPAPAGAVESGVYRNLFREWRPELTESEIEARLQHYWNSLFEGDADSRVYYPGPENARGPTGYIVDIGNDDVRSEGMSYGMMIAVQMDRRDVFDALWNWAWSHMRYADGPREGYFRWQCTRAGCPRDAVPASDGEEYIATALFFAARRWGNRDGIYDYEAQANTILDTMLHKEEMNGGVVDGVTNMFDRRERQVVFVPNGPYAEFTDPSYHLPAFYELWARRAQGWNGRRDEDRAFWREAARVSRAFFDQAAHPETGLTPDYAEFDGRPRVRDGHEDFRFDAFRTAMNWAVDQAWWGRDPQAVARTDRLQAFFERQGMESYVNQYRIDGTPLSEDRSTALIAANGAASLAASHPRRHLFVAALWSLEPPRGRWRYYNGLIQFLAMLHASGRFRAW
jgi:endo-1,4-beta-D-glucanase Y